MSEQLKLNLGVETKYRQNAKKYIPIIIKMLDESIEKDRLKSKKVIRLCSIKYLN